jgi:hypothetical protein
VGAETYEIVVRGTFDSSLVEAPHSFYIDRTAHGLTYLIGSVPDQTQLLKVLHALRGLTIPLIVMKSVSQESPDPPEKASLPDGGGTTEGYSHG